ncbi:cytochrome b/b6 domain-containing protein [Roseibium sp. Sym1]|uniref:cytochrome b/b6 domain-containing protein n=1 Tax=Roseibium sp. Sym1 TaxID=3016006 RepID=UPI0022B34038|nr:cytochrome b/b6 domain-containing protein [Roseibium sp. Sym1]
MAVRYRPAGRALHWLIAALALAALASGYLLTRPGSYSVTLLQVHLAFGAAAGLLSLIRVLLWLTLGAPPPVFETPTRLQANLSGSVHILLRLVPLLLLVSGAGMMILSGAYSAIAGGTLAGLVPFQDLPPRTLHHAAAFLLAGLVGLHGLAALRHLARLPNFRTR